MTVPGIHVFGLSFRKKDVESKITGLSIQVQKNLIKIFMYPDHTSRSHWIKSELRAQLNDIRRYITNVSTRDGKLSPSILRKCLFTSCDMFEEEYEVTEYDYGPSELSKEVLVEKLTVALESLVTILYDHSKITEFWKSL